MKVFKGSSTKRSFAFCFALLLAGRLHAGELLIPEPALQSAIASTLGVPTHSLTPELLQEKLVHLQANDLQLRNLSGLEHAKNLESLVLRDNLIKDLRPLRNLSKLRKLDLSGNRLIDLSTLEFLSGDALRIRSAELAARLSDDKLSAEERAEHALELSELTEVLQSGPWALTELNLSGNRLSGLSGIDRFQSLVQLDVSNNSLIDLEGVGRLKNLVNLYAQQNQLGKIEEYVDRNRNKQYDPDEPFTDQSGNGKRDVNPLVELADLPKLSALHLYDNRIQKIEPLSNLPALYSLLLSGNEIESIESLAQFPFLHILSLGNNHIHSLKGLEQLDNLVRLDLSENEICDLRSIRSLSSLVHLDLNSNLLTDASDLAELRNLSHLGLSRNLLTHPGGVLDLPKLRRLILSENQIAADEDPLREQFRNFTDQRKYLSIGNQREFFPEARDFARSMIGHPKSSEMLGAYLRRNGYPRLIEFIRDDSRKKEDLAALLRAWEKTLRDDKSLDLVSLPVR